MSYLEIALLIAEVITVAALVRIYRKHLILRALFIDFSDWCCRKIDEIVESASSEIMEGRKSIAEGEGYVITDDQARDSIPDVITVAKQEWRDRVDYFQAMLRRNGLSPLNVRDLDTMVFTGLAGLRHLPVPKGRSQL